jgi:hypothetical protein
LPRFHRRRPKPVPPFTRRVVRFVLTRPDPRARPRRVLVSADTLRVPLRQAEARRPRLVAAWTAVLATFSLAGIPRGKRRRPRAGRWVEGASSAGCPVVVPPFGDLCVQYVSPHTSPTVPSSAHEPKLVRRRPLPLAGVSRSWPTPRRPARSLDVRHRPRSLVVRRLHCRPPFLPTTRTGCACTSNVHRSSRPRGLDARPLRYERRPDRRTPDCRRLRGDLRLPAFPDCPLLACRPRPARSPPAAATDSDPCRIRSGERVHLGAHRQPCLDRLAPKGGIDRRHVAGCPAPPRLGHRSGSAPVLLVALGPAPRATEVARAPQYPDARGLPSHTSSERMPGRPMGVHPAMGVVFSPYARRPFSPAVLSASS